jgi:predicted nuclease with RNAse H fold
MPEGTAICQIVWTPNRARVVPPRIGCDDALLDHLIKSADAVGIDAPFGWPQRFVEAVASWTAVDWSAEGRNQLRFRETDFEVRKITGRWPLSVSTDRIALPAMRAMALLHRHGVTDRSGHGKFFEVYPAGSLKCWGLRSRGYKKMDDECLAYRREILSALRQQLPWLTLPDTYAESSDSLDALVASLTARAAMQGLTDKPKPDQLEVARREGWIHLPTEWPRL